MFINGMSATVSEELQLSVALEGMAFGVHEVEVVTESLTGNERVTATTWFESIAGDDERLDTRSALLYFFVPLERREKLMVREDMGDSRDQIGFRFSRNGTWVDVLFPSDLSYEAAMKTSLFKIRKVYGDLFWHHQVLVFSQLLYFNLGSPSVLGTLPIAPMDDDGNEILPEATASEKSWAVVSADSGRNYAFYLPIVALVWKKVMGWRSSPSDILLAFQTSPPLYIQMLGISCWRCLEGRRERRKVGPLRPVKIR